MIRGLNMRAMIPSIYPGYFYTILSECKSRWRRKEADFIVFACVRSFALRHPDPIID
jgi:hypothetical protein